MSEFVQHPTFLLFLSMLFGAIFGFEREWHSKPAGLRTHTLVAGAAASLVLLSHNLVNVFLEAYQEPIVGIDPVRILQAIIIGIGFIGAGTIIKEGGSAYYLTTAASILYVAVIGISVAVGDIPFAIAMTFFGVTVNGGLGEFERRFDIRRP